MKLQTIEQPKSGLFSNNGNLGSLNKPRLLIIDDDPIYCRLVGEVASQKGFEVSHISSARAAYQCIEQLDFDAALVDYDLGVVTGVQLCRFIDRIRPGKAVILVSGYRSIRNLPGQAACLKGFVSKHLSVEEQLLKLQRALKEISHCVKPMNWNEGMPIKSR